MKELFKKILKNFDYRLIKISKNKKSLDIISELISLYNIDLVLDVGANVGQFAKEVRKNDYKKEIISFEPIANTHKKLLENSYNDNKWEIYERCCLGEFDGTTDINISSYSPSSSILDFTKMHIDAKQSATMIDKENVKIIKLDTIAKTLNSKSKNILLKLDTQGYEGQILEGAKEFLKEVDIVFCEMSICEVYKGQSLFKDIIAMLEKYDFKIASLENGFFNNKSKQLLQIDGIFIK